MLGPVEVVRDGMSIAVSGRSAELLSVLLMRAGRLVPTHQLVDALWDDDLPGNPQAAIQTHISRLRDLLEPDRPRGDHGSIVETSPAGYRLNADPDQVDAFRFRRLAREALDSLDDDPARALALSREALGLWRGVPFGEHADRPFAIGEVAALTELRGAAQETLARAGVAAGMYHEMVSEIEPFLADDPLREGLWEQLMLAHYRSGNPAKALRTYRRARQVLLDELGLEPSRQLRELEVVILTGDPASGDDQSRRELADQSLLPEDPMADVPIPIGTFIGRAGQVDAVNAAIDANRLVTLTGPGGLGKSRLAIEAVRARGLRQLDVIAFIRLDVVRKGDDLLNATLDQLGLTNALDSSDPHADLVSFLRTRRCLLVLDGCETVLEDAASLVRHLLEHCADLRVLATSRQPLNIAGESAWPVPFLSVLDLTVDGEVRSEAAELFLDRWDGPPWAALDDETKAVLTHVADRLDGLPLAIELVAVASRGVPLTDVDASLDELLEHEYQPAADDNLRSLEVSLSWGWGRLDDELRDVAAQMAIFEDQWDILGALTVCTDVDPTHMVVVLSELAGRSIIATDVGPTGPTGRYRMTRVQRTYARRKLAESGRLDTTMRRYATHLSQEVRVLGPIRGEPGYGIDATIRVRGDLDLAMKWALDHEPALALGIANQLAPLMMLEAQPDQAVQLLDRALAATTVNSYEPSEALGWRALLSCPRRLVRRPTITFHHPLVRWAATPPESAQHRAHRSARALADIDTSIDIALELGPRVAELGQMVKAIVLGSSYRYDEALDILPEPDSIADSAPVLRTLGLITDANLHLALGDHRRARASAAASIDAAHDTSWATMLWALDTASRVERADDDLVGAQRIFSRVQDHVPPDLAFPWAVAQTELGRIAAHLRDFDRSQHHFGLALGAARRCRSDRVVAGVRENQMYLEVIAGRLDTALEYATIVVQTGGNDRNPIMLAWYEAVCGVISAEQGDFVEAAERYRHSLDLWDEDNESTCLALEGYGVIALADGNIEGAARLLAAGCSERTVIGYGRATTRSVPESIAEVRTHLGDDGFDRLVASMTRDERTRLIDQVRTGSFDSR